MRPKCYIEEKVLEELWQPWKDAIFVKLLGKQVGFFTMRDRLKTTWKTTGGLDVVDVGHGFFMVNFDLPEDKEKVIARGPWMLFDHYLAVRPWVPNFVASNVKIDRTMVWIRFPSLGMEYYDESVRLALATAVGKPIKVDIRIVDASRGRFARVCVEIDLDQPVVGRVWFRNMWFNVEYEDLHLLYKRCGLYGHTAKDCLKTVQTPSGEEAIQNMTAPGVQPNVHASMFHANPRADVAGSVNQATTDDL